MSIFSYDKTYDFAGKQKLFMGVSALFFAIALALLLTRGLNFGIDFTGGTLAQVQYEDVAPIQEIRDALSGTRFDGGSIQEFGSPQEVVIRTQVDESGLGTDVSDEFRNHLSGTGDFTIRRVDMVGPRVGAELREAGIMAMLVAIAGILIYVTFRFEWRFAVAAVAALVHDIIIVLGFVILFDVQVNLDILAALLTILGYSLNDTIVVFDRIREGLSKAGTNSLKEVINFSISRTLTRTTITSLTTFLVVATLFLFGGELIKPLALTLMIGVIVGTYSSIFIAASFIRFLGFDVSQWKTKEARKAQAKAEKERLRAMYEQGTV
jgi:preprotein translocase subunit SecF